MTAAKKFTFDRVFDDSNLLPEADILAAGVSDLEKEPELPTFSEEELNAAREEAFGRGREEGVRESADAAERQIIDILTVLNTRLEELFIMEQAANEVRTQNSVAVATTIVRKFFPHLESLHGIKEVENMVLRTLSEIAEEPKVTISINPALTELLTSRFQEFSKKSRFEGEIVINPDDTLGESDCLIAWSRGGIERRTDNLWQIIDQVIETNLGSSTGLDSEITPEPIAASEPESSSAPSGNAPENTENAKALTPEAESPEDTSITPSEQTPLNPGEDHG